MAFGDWELESPEEGDFESDFGDSPADDPNGEPCIERICVRCGGTFLVNLYLAQRMSDESPLCQCQRCLGAQIAHGRARVRRRDTENGSGSEGQADEVDD